MLLAAALVACSGDGVVVESEPSIELRGGVDDFDRWVNGVTMVVWVEAGAAESAVDHLRDKIEAMEGVEIDRYVDADATYEEFQDFFEDDPAKLAAVTIDELPTSFRLVVDPDDVAAVWSVRMMVEDDEVRDIVEFFPDGIGSGDVCIRAEGSPMFIVWMEPDSSEAERNAVAARLGTIGTVRHFRFVGPEETYAEFVALLVEFRGFLSRLEPNDLPTSFRVTLGHIDDIGPAAEGFDSMAGVRDVLAAEQCA